MLPEGAIASSTSGVPPDPLLHKGLVREVPHNELLELSFEGGTYTLRHKVTLERKEFNAGEQVSLHFHQGFGYIQTSGGVRWVNQIFKSSLLEVISSSRLFVFTKLVDGHVTAWVDELMTLFTTRYPKLKHRGASAQLDREFSLKCMIFQHGRPDCDAKVFWDMDTVRGALDSKGWKKAYQAKWIRAGFSKTWGSMLESHGCAASHQIARCPKPAPRSSEADHHVPMMRRAVSTLALLLLLVHWHASLQSEANKASALIVLDCFLAQFMASSAALRGEWVPPGGLEAVPVEIIIAGGAVQVAAWLASPLWLSIPARPKKGFPKHGEVIAASALLAWLKARPQTCKHALAGFCKLLACHLEQQCMSQELPSDALAGCSDKWFCRKDPEVRRQLAKTILDTHARGSTLNQLGKMAQSLALKYQAYTYHKRITMHHYWMASRRAFAGATHVAVACDATRLGGKEQLAGCLMNLSSGQCCWAPPQAIKPKVLDTSF